MRTSPRTPPTNEVKTYRYLRLAMVALVVMLATAVAVEWASTPEPRCLLTSISAYYYTPVNAVLVGTLVAIGVCMVTLKGSSETEDVLLNLGGMLAPVVAFVPVTGAGSCRSVEVPLRDADADIANNITALLVAGGLGLLATVVIAVVARVRGRSSWDRRHVLGITASTAVYGAGLAWFVRDRESFTAYAHYTAAIAMFVLIVAVVLLNARGYGTEHRAAVRARGDAGSSARVYANRYAAIAAVMVGATAVLGLAGWLLGWAHAVFWIEGTLIVSFAVFWVLQTAELWQRGLRAPTEGPADRRT